MTVDLAAEIVAALASPAGQAAIAAGARVAVDAALAERQADTLEALGPILNITASAARMRLGRDPALAALGVRVGRRTLFRRASVLAYFEQRGAR